MVAQSCPALQFGKIAMIRFSQVSLIRGTKLLLEGADIALNPGERIGLIGANGSGKSSLFALLRGELHTDKGELDYPAQWRVAHVAQESLALDRPAVEYAIDGDSALRSLEAGLAAAEAEDRGALMGELHAALADAGLYTARSRAERLLAGLGFAAGELDLPVSSFSGGWRMRLNLAQALMCPSDLLLLDEPTNHLDLDAIIWLEDWLKRYSGTLIVVSHDRDFLDGVVDAIVHIDSRKLRRYAGNYSSFEAQRAQALVLAASQQEQQARERAPLQGSAIYGKGLAIGYFAQHQVEMLRNDESPLAHLARLAPDAREQELRNYLGSFNFPGDMATDPVGNFSGGEKARLALALIVWQRPNLLLLDEPTNHLDLETREALTVALAQFEGTLVLVSHDRHLLRATTDQFLIVAQGKLQPFDGDLEDYRDWLFRTKLAPEEAVPLPEAEKPAAAAAPVASTRRGQKRREAEDRQRQSAARKPIESRIKRLEEKMAKLNAQKAGIDARLADPAAYGEAQKEGLKTLILDQAYVARELAQLEAEWLEQQQKLEQVTV